MKHTVLIFYVILCLWDQLLADYTGMSTNDEHEESPIIVLEESDKKTHFELNAKFKDMATKMGFKITDKKFTSHNRAEERVEFVRSYNNYSTRSLIFINLYDTSYCQTYQIMRNTNFLCVDDIPLEVCPFNKTVAIATESIMKYKHLYNAIANNNFDVSNNVIICLPNNLPPIFEYQNYELSLLFPSLFLIFQNNCGAVLETNSSVLAIVTPSPYKLDTRTPTVIYNTPPDLHPDSADNLPNSVNLMTSWRPLKYAIVHFLQSMNWFRVAIISDDSEDSGKFLEDLTPLFDDNDIIYTSQMCNKRNCDFDDAVAVCLKDMPEIRTKIVILNLNSMNAKNMIRHINRQTTKYVKWIVREWPFDNDQKFADMIDIFSFTLSPVFGEGNSEEHFPYVSAIMKSLEIINTSYTRALGDRQLFIKRFASENKYIAPYRTFAHIARKTKESFRIVATMKIERTKIEVIKMEKVYRRPPLILSNKCLISTKDFFFPCDNNNLLILISIIILFTLLYLLVAIYFIKFHSSMYNRFF